MAKLFFNKPDINIFSYQRELPVHTHDHLKQSFNKIQTYLGFFEGQVFKKNSYLRFKFISQEKKLFWHYFMVLDCIEYYVVTNDFHLQKVQKLFVDYMGNFDDDIVPFSSESHDISLKPCPQLFKSNRIIPKGFFPSLFPTKKIITKILEKKGRQFYFRDETSFETATVVLSNFENKIDTSLNMKLQRREILLKEEFKRIDKNALVLINFETEEKFTFNQENDALEVNQVHAVKKELFLDQSNARKTILNQFDYIKSFDFI